MLEELRRRNYAESTIDAYIRTVEHFSKHFHRPTDQLGPEHIRQYQALLFTRWKLAPNTVTQRLAALRFFYVQVLKRGWSVAETPYPKKVLHLPQNSYLEASQNRVRKVAKLEIGRGRLPPAHTRSMTKYVPNFGITGEISPLTTRYLFRHE